MVKVKYLKFGVQVDIDEY